MTELTERDFQALCADPAVRRIIDDANRNGRRAALGFWSILLLGLLMVGTGIWYAIANGWPVAGVIFGSFGVLIVYILAAIPLAMTGRALKLPVYEILAARHGMDYAEARAALFGGEPGTESFTDYFQGKFLDGADFATCQAYLLPDGGGRFNGRLFAFGQLHDVIGNVPPDLCRRGRLRLWTGAGEILVAIEGRKGFTPGLGFRFRRGEDRVRAMFDDLAESLATLSRLKAALDPVP